MRKNSLSKYPVLTKDDPNYSMYYWPCGKKRLQILDKPVQKKKLKPKLSQFRPKVRSRHPTHSPLRTNLVLLPFRAVVRLGSTTNEPDTITNGGPRVECNTIEAVRTSANKLKMKQAFTAGGVKTAKWITAADFNVLTDAQKKDWLPLVAKLHNGSRNRGNTLIQTLEEYNSWKNAKALDNYIIEQFHDFSREYRLHVTADGCFYTCRKMLKENTPDNQRWYRNDTNSVWVIETNPAFDKPSNWKNIVDESVKALKSVGLDVGACDVKVQSAKDKKGGVRNTPEFIVIEINSAPSFGDVTLQKYLQEIPRILKTKRNL